MGDLIRFPIERRRLLDRLQDLAAADRPVAQDAGAARIGPEAEAVLADVARRLGVERGTGTP